MPLLASALLNCSQVALSSFALYYSVVSIRKLQRYEDATQRAAQYSNTAEEQLNRTRTTQGAGAIAVSVMLSMPLSSRQVCHA